MARPVTKYLTYRGKTRALKEWALRLHVTPNLLWMRLQRGWSVQKVLETPKRRYDRDQ